nr:hypothetical protein [Shigella dysenteriae]
MNREEMHCDVAKI